MYKEEKLQQVNQTQKYEDVITHQKLSNFVFPTELPLTFKDTSQFLAFLLGLSSSIETIIKTAKKENLMNEIRKIRINTPLVELIVTGILIDAGLLDDNAFKEKLIKNLFNLQKTGKYYTTRLFFTFQLNYINNPFFISNLFKYICLAVKDYNISQTIVYNNIAKHCIFYQDGTFILSLFNEMPRLLADTFNNLSNCINKNSSTITEKFQIYFRPNSYLYPKTLIIGKLNYELILQYCKDIPIKCYKYNINSLGNLRYISILETIFIGTETNANITFYFNLDHPNYKILFSFSKEGFSIRLMFNDKILREIEDKIPTEMHCIDTSYETINDCYSLMYYLNYLLKYGKYIYKNPQSLEEYEKIEPIYTKITKKYILQHKRKKKEETIDNAVKRIKILKEEIQKLELQKKQKKIGEYEYLDQEIQRLQQEIETFKKEIKTSEKDIETLEKDI